MTDTTVSTAMLQGFEPLSSLSAARLKEFAGLCYLEHVSKGLDPFRVKSAADQLAFLANGELELSFAGGGSETVAAGSAEARAALLRPQPIASARALTDVDLIRIDRDLLDIMMTWDQLAAFDSTRTGRFKILPAGGADPALSNWNLMSGVFSVTNLKGGAFANLPSAHIGELLNRFQRIDVKLGEVVIREGDEGDYYYVLESGRAQVSRLVGGVTVTLADLKSGDAFGEEALVSEAKRNATVTMKTNGVLLRLAKQDFIALLKEPLLSRLTAPRAQEKVTAGAQWLDVRYPSEYQYDKLPGAINVPLAEVRNAFSVLDKSREYVVYCQSGRRSSAAAFLLAHRGFRVFLLDGGLWAARQGAGNA
ncbi:MAG TPA: cyclic nucleotide-binding domain-containing protein [Burkholderiales bacterium]|nr:cyclic nucleotide-binding domain-containing protein [Burkholderiales bacterium]